MAEDKKKPTTPEEEEFDLSSFDVESNSDGKPLPASTDLQEGPKDYVKATDELLKSEGEVQGQTISNYDELIQRENEWINEFEQVVGVGLSGEIRDKIAKALRDPNKPKEQALFELKGQILNEKPIDNQPASEVIDEMIGYYKDIANAFSDHEADILNVENTDDFKKVMEESFQPMIKASTQHLLRSKSKDLASAISESKRLENAMAKIRDIFEDLDDQVQAGVIAESYVELQQKIDNLVAIFGFDKNIFDDSVKRYLELSGIDVSNIEFYDALSRASKLKTPGEEEEGQEA